MTIRGERVCRRFGHEGTGQECSLNYPWRVGGTYRFEAEAAELSGGTGVTLHVTDRSTRERRFIATLRDARRVGVMGQDFGFFVEDFRRSERTCLAQPVRQAAIRRAMAKRGGSWQGLTSGFFAYPGDGMDAGNPGTSHCVNVRVEPANRDRESAAVSCLRRRYWCRMRAKHG